MLDNQTSLLDHLNELRKRLIFCIIPFLLAVCLILPFTKAIFGFLSFPARGVIEKWAFFSPQEIAIVYVKIAIFTAVVLVLPVILYQIWKFILPALQVRQTRYASGFIFFTLFSFLAGCVFAYFCLVPISLRFLIGLGQGEFIPVISISKYISFVLSLVLGCGLVFELPVLIWFLSRLGIVNSAFLRKKRKYAIVVIFVLAAIITPTTDPFNMCLLAIPMVVLYEIGIWIARFTQNK